MSSQVEGYDEIMKEPLNFAMTPAKLHEDMYKSLEEFEVCCHSLNFTLL